MDVERHERRRELREKRRKGQKMSFSVIKQAERCRSGDVLADFMDTLLLIRFLFMFPKWR